MAFAFHADRQLVWLDHLAAERDTTAVTGALCVEHADRLVVPLGWFLDDRRLAVPQLFRPRASGDHTGGLSRPGRRRSAGSTDFDVVSSPTLFDLSPAPSASDDAPDAAGMPPADGVR